MTRTLLTVAIAFASIACVPLNFELSGADQGSSEWQGNYDHGDACRQAESCWGRWVDQDEACEDYEIYEGDCLTELVGIDDYCDEIYAGLPYGQFDASDVEDCEDQRAHMEGELAWARDGIARFCGEADALELECEALTDECAG